MPCPLRVLVTGAAGQIGYSLLPLLASGQTFGPCRRVILHLLDIPQAENALKGIVMELEDGAYPCLEAVVATTDIATAFKDIDVAVLVGGFPRKQGMERKDLININGKIFTEQGKALQQYAKETCKVLVVANPANTNCLIAASHAPKIPRKNFSCLTRLDHNRALAQVSLKLGTNVTNVKNVIIWGNHSSTQYPDVNHATFNDKGRATPVREAITDHAWLDGPFVEIVQKRGAAIIAARQLSSAMSAANAVKDHLRDWFLGTCPFTMVSMGVLSDGSYGVEPGLVYSYPVTCCDGEYHIVQGLSLDERSQKLMQVTKDELLSEKADAQENLGSA